MGKSTSTDRELSDLLEAKWMDRLADLLEYKRKYGDCNVPFQFKDNQRLANWVLKQRKFFRKGELPLHRVDQLNAVGFEWTSYRRVTWEQRFEQLRDYQRRVGTTLVAEEHGDPQIVALAQWVKKQRTTQRKKEMGTQRIALLDSIGFVWDVEDSSWETRFHHLVEFQRKYGNQANPKEPGLKGWVYRQRAKFHEGVLPEEKKMKLAAIGFNWGYAGRDSKSKQAIHDVNHRSSFDRLASGMHAHLSTTQTGGDDSPLSSLIDACMMVSTTSNKSPEPTELARLETPRTIEVSMTAVTTQVDKVQQQPRPSALRATSLESSDDDGETDCYSSLNGRVVSIEGGMQDYSERTAHSASTFASSTCAAATPTFLQPMLAQPSI